MSVRQNSQMFVATVYHDNNVHCPELFAVKTISKPRLFPAEKVNLLVEQFFPVYPGRHVQEKLLTKSVQFPPFRHGPASHSSISNQSKKQTLPKP